MPVAQVSALVDEMNQAGADWQLMVYGGAMHGFPHQERTAVPGVAYHALADPRFAAAMRGFFLELFARDERS